ncbi:MULTISPECIES: alpha/beta family hydrolase [Nocardiaceae]|uniref:Alpha/beta-hydrolase family hydrolase n=1 Tax=Rhodococcoides corynebacterioides TaxID=53972 RepID=A0ABS2KUL1_9NOCA|nr:MULTISPECIES: alpha/beta family hydrolase [Rhodococcus]MBM7415637.1 putative alpha/beta-hydrolase family hydrolase [Rhodococcus corynebacterioides]MBP1118099.1 putative alpha/beta-hydrolase family hydrolase [Rhodococcus sp. PvP016]
MTEGTVREWRADGIHGVVHEPAGAPVATAVLAHGAGSNCDAAVLVAVATELADRGVLTARIDLPFRQARPKGPPNRAGAAADRAGIAAAVRALGARGPVIVGGHSYGGRQASMLLAEDPGIADALLALSYPLHPPTKPDTLRTEHFPAIAAPTVIVHGSRDTFATGDELREHTALIGGAVTIVTIEGAGHDLAPARKPTARLTADAVMTALVANT